MTMKKLLAGSPVLLALFAAAAPAADKRAIPETAALVKGNSQFALDLYGKLSAKDGNLFFSPFSISTALGMTWGGARGETAEQMARTLHFTLVNEGFHQRFGELLKEVNGEPNEKRGYQLNTANALWGQKGYPFAPNFVKLMNDNYGAGFNEVDFQDATEASRQTINTWVEKETHSKIKDLLKKGIIKSNTRLVLTNAIYFKGDWASQFKKDVTKEGAFRVTSEKVVKAPLMHQSGNFRHFEDRNVQGLEMPYVGKDLSMVVLLPKQIDGLADLEKALAGKLAGWLGQMQEQRVDVTLPKFKTASDLLLNQPLIALGMPLPFTEDKADFSGLNDGKGSLFISAVVHKAFVEVNEEGTEAAAATGVIISDPSAPPKATAFKADHPFLFLIRDNRNGSILFIGRIANPVQ
jgi:serpin B